MIRSGSRSHRVSRRLTLAMVTSLFLLWGVANNMNDTLLAAFKRIMSMSDLQTSLVQFAFYGAYFCVALPAAFFIRRFSYKTGIIVGLALYASGTMLFTPAAQAVSYPFFLFAIYVMAAGCAVLETTANPMIMCLGPAETATRRLNIAQVFNPLGAIIGIFLSRNLILNELHSADAAARTALTPTDLAAMQRSELSAVSGAYMLIGVILAVLLVAMSVTPMPRDRDDSDIDEPLSSIFRRLFASRRYRSGVVAQFFYVGAQTCVWSFTIRYVMATLHIREAAASEVFLYSILAFTLFRVLFTFLMKFVKPSVLIALASVGALVCTGIVVCCDGILAVCALVGISAFMSLMFPTIYGIALSGTTGAEAKFASSGLIMSILGGALITPVQGLISDVTGSIAVSFVVPMVCFAFVLLYSLSTVNAERK